MGLGFIPFLLFVAFVVIRIAKEAGKVEQGRPGTGNPVSEPESSVEGSRNISDFLEELKRMQSPPPPPDAVYEEKRELRQRVREATRQNREMKTRVLEMPPPVVETFRALPVEPPAEEDFYSISNESAYSERISVETPGGLAHPVFSGVSSDRMTMAKRAIVLREVLGPPVGLR